MRFTSLTLVLLVVAAALPLSAQAASLEQRLLFEIVYKQIGTKPGLLAIHTEALQNYPLFPYLQAAVYEKRLAEANSQTSAFIEQYKGAPFAEKLRQEWLNRLAKNDQGATFLKMYVDNGNQTTLCHWMRFSLAVPAERKKILEQFHAWWLSGKSIPKECGTVEVAWRTGYWPTHGNGMDDYWTRLDNAYRLKDKTMIAATRKLMPAGDKALLDLWQQLDKDPEKTANLSHFKGDSRKEWVVRAYGMDRLAWRDPEYAAEVFRQLERDARYPDDLHHRNYQTISLSLASSGSPKAADYLDSVPAGFVDERVTTWRVMDAMRRQDFAAADRWMLQLSIDEAQAPRWRYLIGRSADLQGDREMADILWRSLRKDYNYYGFLARARTGELAAMPSPVLEWSAATLVAVRQLPGMQRAAEWRALDDDQRARKEWYATARQLDEDGIKAAVVIADEWLWKDVVIWSLGRLRIEGAWDYRFPLLYREALMQESDRRSIDPSWAFAITRQESAFAHKARSPAGAMGLMQLMPATAKITAKRFKINYRNQKELLSPSVNIRLGVAHLGELVQKNEGNFVYATAAYNAGQGRVNRWRRQFEGMPVDLWIESIPYKETQHYVKNVMAYSLVYSRQLNKSSDVFDFLTTRMEKGASSVVVTP